MALDLGDHAVIRLDVEVDRALALSFLDSRDDVLEWAVGADVQQQRRCE